MKKSGKKQNKKLVNKKVKIITEKREFKGRMLESYDPEIVLLKLDSGYNVGIEKKKIKKIQDIKEKEKKEIIKEILPKAKSKLPKVAFIVTGGTISSRIDYKSGAVKPLTKPEDVIALSPQIQEIVNPIVKSPFMIFSENMTGEEWKKLAIEIEKQLNSKEVKGVIVLCGTDTLHYTASAIAFMLGRINKPVVFTYSQRSIDRGSTDSLLNLTCACYSSLSDIGEVVIVGHATTNDNFCYALRAVKTRKMHTSRRDTFRPINDKPIAIIYEDGKMEKVSDYEKVKNIKVGVNPVFENKVALIKWHPNLNPKILDFYIKEKYKALVIEATGFGHVALEGKFSWLNKIKEVIKSNILVCFACQTLYGRLDSFVYTPGRELKKASVLYLGDILPETAYTKLGYLFGKEKDPVKVRLLMTQNLVQEFNDRLTEKDFLI